MKRRSFAAAAATLATLGALASPSAAACGVCIEDKVAATYDHAVIQQATAKRQQVVFVGVDGAVDGRRIDRAVSRARVPGVVPGTLRTSAAPPAFSFVLERTKDPAQALAGFRTALNDGRAHLALLRIVRDGRIIEAP